MIRQSAAADSIRAALGEVFSRAPYQWRDESTATLVVRRWWRALTDWLERLAGDHPELFRVLIWGLVAVLALIAVHSIWLLIRATRRPVAAAGATVTGTGASRDAEWYRREADRLFRAGHHVAALQAQFVRLALELDRRDVLRFHPSKTPLEYVAEVPEPGGRRREFAGLIRDLYRYAFAGDRCGPAEYRAWCEQADPERYVRAR